MTWERSSAVRYVGPFHAVPCADVFDDPFLLIDAAGRWKVAGVVYSTALFAISPLVRGVHSVALRSPAAPVGLGLVGLVWGIAYARTGSLRFTIVGHTCANLLGLSVPMLLNRHVPAGLG